MDLVFVLKWIKSLIGWALHLSVIFTFIRWKIDADQNFRHLRPFFRFQIEFPGNLTDDVEDVVAADADAKVGRVLRKLRRPNFPVLLKSWNGQTSVANLI